MSSPGGDPLAGAAAAALALLGAAPVAALVVWLAVRLISL